MLYKYFIFIFSILPSISHGGELFQCKNDDGVFELTDTKCENSETIKSYEYNPKPKPKATGSSRSAIPAYTDSYSLMFSGTNFSYLNKYPLYDCRKPSKLIEPYMLDNQAAINAYNIEVDYYNSQLNEYFSCIDEYIENAMNDIKRIKINIKDADDKKSSSHRLSYINCIGECQQW